MERMAGCASSCAEASGGQDAECLRRACAAGAERRERGSRAGAAGTSRSSRGRSEQAGSGMCTAEELPHVPVTFLKALAPKALDCVPGMAQVSLTRKRAEY